MSLNKIIAQAIDCPMMDCKNVADIIAGYSQYNILQHCEVKNVKFEISGGNYDDEMMYLFDGEYFYVLQSPHTIVFEKGQPGNFITSRTLTGNRSPDGKPIYGEKTEFIPNHSAIKDPSKYLFIECPYCIRIWRIVKRYNSFDGFCQSYSCEVLKWDLLLDREELLDGRRVNIIFNGSIVFTSHDDDEDRIEMTHPIREAILTLWVDWRDYVE